MSKIHNKYEILKDLNDLYYAEGLHHGRWEDEEQMDSSAEQYLATMVALAEKYEIEYDKDLSNYIVDEEYEAECYTMERMGSEIFLILEEMLADLLEIYKLERTQNLISCETAKEQELATLEKILRDYREENYNNMYVLIMNYLGHVPHYCGHKGLVYRLLNNFTYSLEKKAKGTLTEENDGFVKFVQSRISHVKDDFS